MIRDDLDLTPMLEALSELKSLVGGLDEKADTLIEFVIHHGEKVDRNIKKFLDDYEHLITEMRSVKLDSQEQKKRFDQLWELLNKALDEQFNNMNQLDQDMYLSMAQEAYAGSWNNLDEKSRVMLATGLSIQQAIRRTPGRDLSPAVIEFCRVFENELRRKLYDGFVPTIDPYNATDAKKPYTEIVHAAESYHTNGDYFISMWNMIRCVKEIKNSYTRCSSSQAFSQYLTDHQWNKNRLTDRNFIDMSLDYTLKYRNTSAHPSIMDKEDADNCVRLTKILVQHFISCLHVNKLLLSS